MTKQFPQKLAGVRGSGKQGRVAVFWALQKDRVMNKMTGKEEGSQKITPPWSWRDAIMTFNYFLTYSLTSIKVARYSFSGSIPPKFEHKLRRHKQRFGKIATTVLSDKDENLLWLRLQWHWGCPSNEMTLLPILIVAVFLGTGKCSSKIVYGSFFFQ